MGWLLYVCVQAAVIALSVWLAVVLGSTWSILPAVFGLWFAWRSIRHPDYVYRRLAAASLFGALGLGGLYKGATLEWLQRTGEDEVLYRVSVAIGDAAPFLIYALAFFALVFVCADLVRMHLQRADDTAPEQQGDVSVHGQYLEVKRDENDLFRMRGRVTIVNGSRQEIAITGARILHHGLLPSMLLADLVEPRSSLDAPMPSGGFEIPAAGRSKLAIKYRRRSRLRAWALAHAGNRIGWLDWLSGDAVVRLDSPQSWARKRLSLEIRDASRYDDGV